MRIVWDNKKRVANFHKHGIDFIGAEDLFANHTLTLPDTRFAYGENRFITFGLMNQRVVAVAHVETRTVIRIISIRKACRHEQESYFQNSPFTDSQH